MATPSKKLPAACREEGCDGKVVLLKETPTQTNGKCDTCGLLYYTGKPASVTPVKKGGK